MAEALIDGRPQTNPLMAAQLRAVSVPGIGTGSSAGHGTGEWMRVGHVLTGVPLGRGDGSERHAIDNRGTQPG